MLKQSLRVPQEKKRALRLIQSPSPFLTTITLMLVDAAALVMAFELSARLWDLVRLTTNKLFYLEPTLVMGLFILAYAVSGLYPGVGIRPHEELKKLTVNTILMHVVIAASAFLLRDALNAYSRGVLLTSCLLALMFVPLARTLVRDFCAHRFWWGVPVLILGAGDIGQNLVKRLKEQPRMGFKPIAIVDNDPQIQGSYFGVPMMGPLSMAPKLAKTLKIHHAILCLPDMSQADLTSLLRRHTSMFPYLILLPNFLDSLNLWVTARDLGGVLGLEVKHNLLFPSSQLIKRILDITLTIAGILIFLPLLILIALAIKLSSRGPILFAQERLGMDGTRFKALKFRSMYLNAEAKLEEILQSDRELRQEFEVFHKLRRDPSVIGVGRFLRKFSLDELPQMWNVLKGEMSLVGPRAYIPNELAKMNSSENMILKALPGITGLWQVRGRNNCSFQQRLDIDIYYVRNWSLSLDFYILASTFRVVLLGKGAY